MFKLFKKQSPARIIALGFLTVILLGSILLSLPCSIKQGVNIKFIDALYTSTSAVCVTGLIAVDPGTTFTPLGQFFLAFLIQIGGLGVTSVGAGIILAMGKKVYYKGRVMIMEASNLFSAGGIIKFIKDVFIMTLIFELIGAIVTFTVFIKYYSPLKALGLSLFHAVAAFNNSGFDILGLSGEMSSNINLIPFQNDIVLNVITCFLIFFGGIGFLVIREAIDKRFNWKKFSMHSKVVLSVSAALLVVGTALIKLTEDITWLGAVFFSFSARTAGFSTFLLSEFSNAGLFVLTVLMFIGASPGSTGGGIKTSTFFVLLQGIKASATNKSEKAFKYSIPESTFKKASIITLIGLVIVVVGTYILSVFEPHIPLSDLLFEVTSAFGTVGLSTGITSSLSTMSKAISIIIMYIGRLGPLTIVTLWHFNKGERAVYPNGNIAIG